MFVALSCLSFLQQWKPPGQRLFQSIPPECYEMAVGCKFELCHLICVIPTEMFYFHISRDVVAMVHTSVSLHGNIHTSSTTWTGLGLQ